MSQSIIVPLNLTVSELIKASFYLAIRTRLVKMWFLFSLVIGSFSLLTNTVLSPNPVINWGSALFSFLIVPLFYVCFFCIMTPLLSFFLYKTKRNHFTGVSYQFTHWGIEKTGSGVNVSTSWQKVIKVKENKDFFFMFISANDAYIVQKKNFATESQMNDFRIMLEEHSSGPLR